MGRAESGSVSAEATDRETQSTASDAYISPLADFVLLFLVTGAVALALVVLL